MPMLEKKIAIVTGASSGLGCAIALRYAKEGATVVIGDVCADPIEGGETTLSRIRAEGAKGMFLETDISRWDDVDALVSQTVKGFGRLDIMVNNAAIYTSTDLLETSPQQWDRVIAVNVTGFFYWCNGQRSNSYCRSRSATRAAASSTFRRSTAWSPAQAISPTGSARVRSSR